MRLKTIVIDDEPLAAMLLEGYVSKTPFLEHIATFSTAIEAMNSDSLASADLLLLDIQMPTLTGLEFSRMVDPRTRIIFTTAFNQYAIEGYKVNALDYLLKPISYADFLVAVQRAVEWFELKQAAAEPRSNDDSHVTLESIYVKSEYRLVRIDLDKIIYVEGLKDYVRFFVEGESKSIISLMNMKRVEEILPSDQFIRVHRSYILRKDKIKAVERSRILLDGEGGEYISVGESYKSQLQEYLRIRSI